MPPRSYLHPLRRIWHRASGPLAVALLLAYALDRLLKLAAVAAFFRRRPPPAPVRWPDVVLVQPVTRGRHDLGPPLRARRALDYPGAIRHLIICDRDDAASQRRCRDLLGGAATIVLAAPDGGSIATKVAKLRAASPYLDGAIVCCVDDDVILPPDALRLLVAPLADPAIGATFGVARYESWGTVWSSLMSLFVNSNALLSYLPLTYLAAPFTITGHLFALRRADLAATGDFAGLEGRIDDDHELARRLRRSGLRLAQTPLIYAVTNDLDSPAAYAAQLRRWFVFPRQAMLPQLAARERAVLGLGSVGIFIPGILALLALAGRRRVAIRCAGLALALFLGGQGTLEWRYLGGRTPPRRLPLLPVVGVATPQHILAVLVAPPIVEWRGQRLRIARGGAFTVLDGGAGPSPD